MYFLVVCNSIEREVSQGWAGGVLAKGLRDILGGVSYGNTPVIIQQIRDGNLMEHFSHPIKTPSQLRQADRLM